MSFVPVFVIYSVGWLVVLVLLPRRTKDPGALLPGALLMGATLALMHGISELYLPDRFQRASQLYGSIGATVVTLGWFFVLGRAAVVSMGFNAAVFEVYGSVSQVFFGLPVLRVLPRGFPKLRTFFYLDRKSADKTS